MTPRTPTRRHHHHHHHHSHPRNNDDNVTNYTTSNVHPKSGSASARNSRSHVTTSSSSIWDHMPSSPPALQPSSPSSHHVIPPKSNRSARRTLEWACEAARLENTDDDEDEEAYYDNAEDQQIPRRGHEHSPRLSDKRSSHQKQRHAHQQQQSQEQQRALGIKTGSTRDSRNIRQQTLTRGAHAHAPDLDEVAGRASAISVAELTEDEADEAITPPSTLGKDDSRWSNPPAGKTKSLDSGRTMSLISSSLDGPSTAPTTISGSMSGSGRMSMLADSHSQGVVIVEPPGSGPMESGNRDGTPLSLQQKPIMKDLEELGLEAYADLEPDEDVMRAALALCRLGRRK
ncbi:hypothetical protein AX16_000711 [Volvariella volvacea WC 439]|nr:hypothetical protein AX16_000711 [Volvariella volvacea WC 439]